MIQMLRLSGKNLNALDIVMLSDIKENTLAMNEKIECFI